MTALVMGVLNVTPDSFSDGGQWLDPEAAIAHGFELFDEGAAIVDVGGESTRPGAAEVDENEELRRVIPVVRELSTRGRVSIDTTKARVAELAVEAGATLINDVSASLHKVAAATGTGWVAMHMQGTPRTMQDEPRYTDVIVDIRDYLVARAEDATAAGVKEIWIDPGIGFGKTLEHNLDILGRLEALTNAGWPVCIGTSRKSFIGKILGGASIDQRFEGSLVTAVLAVAKGAEMVRVHDVGPTVRALEVLKAVGADAARTDRNPWMN